MSLTTDESVAAATDDTTLVDTSCTATIDAPIEQVDIPAWCFSLADADYQACSHAHYAAGSTTAPDGRRMSINVEVVGGTIIVQHYVEDIAEPDHLRLVSHSDLFTSTGRTKIDVTWELKVTRIDDRTCQFTNRFRSSAPPEMLDFLAGQGLDFDTFRTARRPNSEAHNREETPGFAKSIERHARARAGSERS
ncbi:hypothetical protein [Streptomyces sp. NPDC046821]|uniref:hypothetical protein n=1 Tax=Streptomyces sp. NPDC046821 TaxID=3154702 RepID=UPI0034088AC6